MVITTLGDKAVIHGVRSIVDEMVYNLVDNAVKYNKKTAESPSTWKKQRQALPSQ